MIKVLLIQKVVDRICNLEKTKKFKVFENF